MAGGSEDGLVTIVTGAAAGIGAALCRRLAVPGARLHIHTGRSADALAGLAAELEASGAEVAVQTSDFRQPAQAAELVAAAAGRWNRIDRIVHAAGFADRTPVSRLDEAGFLDSLRANTLALFHLASAALPFLRRSPAGRVVAVSSFLAHRTRLGPDMAFPASSASKAALEGLVRSLAAELAPDRVTVNAVVPGFITKDAGRHAAVDPARRAQIESLIPLQRYGAADEVAATIAFLLGEGAAYITGQSIHVDGGLTL